MGNGMRSTKVTDPSVLAQLNSGSTKVTNPALLSQLNGEEEDNENLLQKVKRYGLKGLQYGVQDPAIGLLNMGREFANLPHKISGGHIPEFSPSDYDFSAALGVEHPEPMDKLIQGLAQYAPSMAIPGVGLGRAGQAITKIPGAGKFINKAISEAIPQALYAGAQAPEGHELTSGAVAGGAMMPFSMMGQLMQGTNPIARNVARGLTTAGGAYLGREAAKSTGFGEVGSDVAALIGAALGGRGYRSPQEMKRGLTEGVSPDVANPNLKAASRLGLDYLTPAEAGVSQLASKAQGALGRTPEGAKLLNERSKARQESESRAINKTLDMIYSPGKMDKQVESAYKAINEVNLPQEFPMQFKDNEIINEAKRLVESTPAYKESLKSLMPKNVKLKPGQSDAQATSLVYWDHVKRAMDDMVAKAERAGNKNEARIISNTRANMRDQMDASYPEYKVARSLYERKIVREGLEKVFDQKEITGQNFYRALASDKKFKETLSHLKNAPEATQNLKDMRLVFKNVMGPPTIRTAKGKEEYGMNMHRNEGDFFKHMIEHAFTRGGSDKAAIEFITSKDWAKQLEEINKISSKQMKAVAFGLALSKGISQAAGHEERKPLELELVGGHR
jgi:hypothetical protein